ncbi:hypothetical protein [Sporomusa silvacetica]|uniref:hypothetical protein n=1 Tax=Sporomusa silvacetica TaxID=55504 RepID=UPI001181C01B
MTQFQPYLQAGADQLGVFSVLAVPALFILLGIAGIHPLVLAVILGKVLMTLSLPLSAVSLALLLLVSSSVTFIVSPLAGMVLLTAKFLDVKPVEVALKWNGVYGLLFLVVGILFAYLWG